MNEAGFRSFPAHHLDPGAQEFFPAIGVRSFAPQVYCPYPPPVYDNMGYPQPIPFSSAGAYVGVPSDPTPPVSLPSSLATPSRTLLLSLVPPCVSESTVRRELEVFGDVRSVEMERRREGLVTVHFYDVRDAEAALVAIHDQHMQQQCRLGRHYDAVLNTRPIKELRETPRKKNQRFVEFYDVRNAAKAMTSMNGKDICGQQILIEFSRHGGQIKKFPRSPQNVSLDSSSNNYTSSRNLLPPPSPSTQPPPNTERRFSGRQKLLLNMLDNHCIHCNEQIADGDDQPLSSYDFVYLPIDFINKCNVGYGFVNMTSPEAALRLYKAFHHQSWEVFNSRKICDVTYARLQGLEALREHFKNSKFPKDAEEYMPVVFMPPRDGRMLTEPVPIIEHTPGDPATPVPPSTPSASVGSSRDNESEVPATGSNDYGSSDEDVDGGFRNNSGGDE
ncbi:protein terminal ear1 [Dorcoceras hygrometricum]|uniref:Protein terminal ear1 n=1 Tax=Dorcoceras hygrometricum TaxID=472368 RepID=A0A2Z6ZYT4_9LAMI|nr:protein terminal ear1 [Dorcoceras hygrometricum]